MDSPFHEIFIAIKKKKKSLVNIPYTVGHQKPTTPTSSKKV